jgi:hypothetical protein
MARPLTRRPPDTPDCPVCHGIGGTITTPENVQLDTAAAVVEAVRAAAPLPALIACPACHGTGLLCQ